MSEEKTRPVISDRNGRLALWLNFKRDGQTPFLSGKIDDRRVIGRFTKLDKNAAEHGEKYPTIKFQDDNTKEFINNIAVYPQNDRADGDQVYYDTVVVSIQPEGAEEGAKKETVYARVWGEMLENASVRELTGFTNPAVERPKREAGAEAQAEQQPEMEMENGPSF